MILPQETDQPREPSEPSVVELLTPEGGVIRIYSDGDGIFRITKEPPTVEELVWSRPD